MSTSSCNGTIDDSEYEKQSDKILVKVVEILKIKGMNTNEESYPVIFNGDCRGYALKIDDEYIKEHSLSIYRDMGGFGIIAPDLTND